MSIAAIEERGLVVVAEFLDDRSFWRWTRTSRRFHAHPHNAWWLRQKLRPFLSNFDKAMRRTTEPKLWAMYKRLKACLRMCTRTIMTSKSFPRTYFDRGSTLFVI